MGWSLTSLFETKEQRYADEVLYPKNIYDIIDYFVWELVKREQAVRICKSCGRYFAITGRTDVKYCDLSTLS